MAARPNTVPRWAETATGTPSANVTTPASGEQDSGWTNGQNVVSSGKMNWLFRTIYDWILYLRDGVFVAGSGSNLPGITATGDWNTSNPQPGVVGTGGAAISTYVSGPGGSFTGGTSTGTGAHGPGVVAKAGGGAAPARGAVNLVPQAAPYGPADGDLWVETTSNVAKARIAGFTKTLADTGYVDSSVSGIPSASHTWGGTQTFTNPIAGPSSTPVAITPAANWTAFNGLGYWKDAAGIVHVKGQANAAAGAGGIAFTLPVGFRPASPRYFAFPATKGGATDAIQKGSVGADGTVAPGPVGSGDLFFFDGISFLAEQ